MLTKSKDRIPNMNIFKKLFGKANAPTGTFRVWYREEAMAKKVVAPDPTGLHPDLRVMLAYLNKPTAEHIAILDAVERGKYKIVPSTNPNGDEGFDLVIFY